MHLSKSHLGVFIAVESLGNSKTRKIKNCRKNNQLVTSKKEGTVKSCSGHYLHFKIIFFEKSESIFDVSLLLDETKFFSRKEQTDAEARGGIVPGTPLLRRWLQCLRTRGKHKGNHCHHNPTAPSLCTSLPLCAQPRDH